MFLTSKTSPSSLLVVAGLAGYFQYADSERGPNGSDNEIVSTLVDEQPNATGHYPLRGPDTTSPDLNTDPVEG